MQELQFGDRVAVTPVSDTSKLHKKKKAVWEDLGTRLTVPWFESRSSVPSFFSSFFWHFFFFFASVL